MKITDFHFNMFKDCIMDSLEFHSFDTGTMGEIINLIEIYRKECVTVFTPLIERIGGESKMP